MSERTWRIVPESQALSIAYLLIGALLAFNAVNQLRDDMAVLPLISGLAAVALVVTALMGLVHARTHTRTGTR
ncbi:hypothetical protein [Streptomyces apricus]|uniref:Uncharacterized protein n=1 Tax=Streptomyces apricus TaxID=1828112 RepID=A0A5A9ZX15_9ACTN|nr:hypothetical protein [Streptomyces apricus]KAA0921282.1 hypothetical protein FGF04_36450 [Streptomyces apricus]